MIWGKMVGAYPNGSCFVVALAPFVFYFAFVGVCWLLYRSVDARLRKERDERRKALAPPS